MSGNIEINDEFSRALLHEAGHVVAFNELGHQFGGVAAIMGENGGLFFCVLTKLDEQAPDVGLAAGSGAEKMLLGDFNESAANKDRGQKTSEEYRETVDQAIALLLPRRRKLKRVHSLLKNEVSRRMFPEDFAPDELPEWKLDRPYCVLLRASEAVAAIGKK